MTYSPGAVLRGRRRAAGRGAAGAGGNALSYRPDAVPGYQGYTPGAACVPPTRHTKLTERDPAAPLATAERRPSTAADGAGGTTHGSAFQIDPQHDYSRDPRVRRPPAAAATSPAAAAADKGIGKSTYQAELLLRNSSDIGGSCGASGGSASAPCSPAHRPAIAAVRPGYLTTAAASQLPVAERYAALSLSAGGSPKSPGSGAAVERCSSWQAIVGARPWRSPGTASAGVAPALAPAPERGPAAGQQPAPRPRKEDALMQALDQHSRGRVPGYTGHRPQHNVCLEPPPPSALTTWGAASQQALRRAPAPPSATHAIDSRKGLLSGDFFTAGASGFVSENGLAEAARFHESTRPLEGRMRIPQPSRTAPRGALFTG